MPELVLWHVWSLKASTFTQTLTKIVHDHFNVFLSLTLLFLCSISFFVSSYSCLYLHDHSWVAQQTYAACRLNADREASAEWLRDPPICGSCHLTAYYLNSQPEGFLQFLYLISLIWLGLTCGKGDKTSQPVSEVGLNPLQYHQTSLFKGKSILKCSSKKFCWRTFKWRTCDTHITYHL